MSTMQRFRGTYISEKASGRQGIIESISPAWVSVLWDDPDRGFLKESIRRGDADSLARVQVWTGDHGWLDASSVLASKPHLDRMESAGLPKDEGAVYVQPKLPMALWCENGRCWLSTEVPSGKPLAEARVDFESDIRQRLRALVEAKAKASGKGDCQCPDKAEGKGKGGSCSCKHPEAEQEEDFLMPKRDGKSKWGPDSKEAGRYTDNVLRGGVGEAYVTAEDVTSESEDAIAEAKGKKRRPKIPAPGSKTHSPHKREPHLGKGADNKRERVEKQMYSCAKNPAELGLGGEAVKKITGRLGNARAYKQFCVKVKSENPASDMFVVNAKGGRKSYMKRYNADYKKCVDAARGAEDKPPRTRKDGKPNCGPAYGS